MTYKDLAKRLRLLEYQFDVYHPENDEVDVSRTDFKDLIELIEEVEEDDCPF